jgi:hypothetical protein
MMRVTATPGHEADGVEVKIGGIYPMLIRFERRSPYFRHHDER